MKKTYKKITALITLAFAALPLSAQEGMDRIQSLADKVLEVFQGPFVKTILVIFLCGSAVAYGFNKDNEKIKRNCIAIGVACAILVAASSIVGMIMGG
jgi:type IV secretory pathway VirB2 component (pilin)